MAKLTLASVDALRTRFADDAACDAALAAFADTAVLRAPLRELVAAQHRYLQAEFEVAQVADVLRRDQKYAPVGRPSINIVQLRKQQAATKQAALIARQVVAQAAQTFVRVSGLAVKAKQSPSEACVAWLAFTASPLTRTKVCAACATTWRAISAACLVAACCLRSCTMLIARQVVAQAAQTFVRVSGLAVKAKQSPSEACGAWLGALR